jgi:hypothetical protein
MSAAQALITTVFGVLFAVLILLRLAATRQKQRALRDLPPNTSGGTPVVATRRERWLAFLFCAFVLSVVSWLTMATPNYSLQRTASPPAELAR